MAKTRDPFKQNYNTDDEWDLGSFDDFDSAYDGINVPNKKIKGRKPLEDVGPYVTPVLKGASFSAGNALKDAILRKMPATKALADEAMGFRSELDNVKRELMGGVSPMVNSLKQIGRQVAPKLDRLAPGMAKKIKELSKEEEQYRPKTKEELRTQAINEAITKTLKLQIEQSQAETEENRLNTVLDRKISEKRHVGMLDVLKDIRREAEYRTEFFKTTTVGYYTKSLEIGMQQLYTSKDILATTQVMAKVVEEGMKGLLHNSMLPDIQKQRLSETWKDITRGALINKFNTKLKSLSGFGTKLLKNLGGKVSSTAGNISSGLDMAQSGIELENTMAEMGGKTSGPGMIAGQALEMGGDAFSKWVISKITKANPQLAKTLNNKVLKPISKGPEEFAKNLSRKSYLKLKEMNTNRENGGIKNALKNLFLDAMELGGSEKDKITNVFSKNPTDSTVFDVATRTSIVEIIPGYLSKILQQVTIANKGKAEELVYDDRSRDFIGASEYRTSKINQMHKDPSMRTGSYFAKGSASMLSGTRYHATGADDFTKSTTTFKDVRKDIETVMRNHAVEELNFRPDHIKQYADASEVSDQLTDAGSKLDDYIVVRYIQTAFASVKNPAVVAKFMTKALYSSDGVLNTTVRNEFESSIMDLAGDDEYKNIVNDVVNAFGTGRYLKDHLDDKYSKKRGMSDLVIDKDRIINTYKQNYNTSKYDELLTGYDSKIYGDISNDGFSINEVLEPMPASMQKFANRYISPDTLNKRRFYKEKYNDLTPSKLGMSYTGYGDDPSMDDIEYGQARTSSITNTISSKVEVVSTSGKHVLLDPIIGISDRLDSYIQHKTDTQYSTTATVDNTNTNNHLLAITNILQAMREENKALSIAGMMSSAPGADPKKVQGIWKSIGSLGISSVKGAGNMIGGTFKLGASATSGIATGILKAATATLPSIITASGTVIGGGLSGIGSVAGSLISANASMFKGLTKGVGATIGAGARGLGKLFGKSWGSKRDATGKMSSIIKDLYTPGSDTPVIKAKDFMQGVYTKTANGSMKLIHSIQDIAGSVYNQSGDMLVSAEEIAQGLVDRTGKKVDIDKLKESSSGLIKSIGSGIGTLANGGMGLLKGLTLGPLGLTGKMLGLGAKGLGWAGGKLGNLLGGLLGKKKSDSDIDITRSFIRSSVTDKLDEIIKQLKPKSAVGDHDGDGIREGSYRDFMDEKEKRKSSKQDNSKMPPWMASILKKIPEGKGAGKETEGDGFFTQMFYMFGGSYLVKKFTSIKNKIVGGLFGMLKGMKSMMGKGLAGLLGMFFGKGAMTKLASSAGNLVGSASKIAVKAGSATMAGGASLLGMAGKAASKTGAATKVVGGANKIALILERAKKYIPEKLIKFLKIDKIAPVIAKKIGPKAIGSLAAKLLSGPMGWIVLAGGIVMAATTGMMNAVEILGLPEDTKLSTGDRLIVSLSAALCEGVFVGLIDTKWLAELLGVNTLSYLKQATGGQEPGSLTAADKANIAKSSTSSSGSSSSSPASQDFKEAIAAAQTSSANADFKNKLGQKQSGVTVSGLNGSSTNIDLGNIKPVSSGPGSNQIGEFVKKFESGTRGTTAIAWDKHGGTSYGTYQMAAGQGAIADFIKWCETSGGQDGKVVATEMKKVRDWNPGKRWQGTEAAAVWLALANKGFLQRLEHDYIYNKHYKPALSRLPQDLQQLVSGNRGLQEMLWSMSVQHGPGSAKSGRGAVGIILKHWKPGMSAEELVRTVYADRGNYFSSSTPEVQASVKNRFKNESAVILGLLGQSGVAEGDMSIDPNGQGASTRADNASTGNSMGTANDNYNATMNKYGASSSGMAGTQTGNTGGSSSGGGYSSSGAGVAAISPDGDTTTSLPKTTEESISKLKELGVPAKITLGGGGYTSVSKVDSNLLKRFTAATEEFYSKGGKLSLTSAYRSSDDQRSLSGTVGAAKVGNSPHQKGLAFDIGDINGGGVKGRGYNTGTVADQFEPFAEKHGLWRPYGPKGRNRPNEEQHFELKRGVVDTDTPENKGLDGGGGDKSEAPADKSTELAANTISAGAVPDSADTQKTSTNSGSTSVPAGGGAGSYTTDHVDNTMANARSDTSTYQAPYTPSSGVSLQPVIDLLTTMSSTLITIANNSNSLNMLGQLVANNNNDGRSTAIAASTGKVVEPKNNGGNTTTPAKRQVMAPSHAPINVTARQSGIPSLA